MTKVLSNIGNQIGQGLGKAYNYTITRKWCAKTLESAARNPEKYAIGMVMASIVSKDLVNCYYYTTLSLNNKKIPEEKRGFVASLDAMNGVIMVFGQILAGIGFEKILSKTLFDNFISKKLDNDVLKTHAKKLVTKATEINKNLKIEDIHKELIKQYGSESKKYKAMKGGFGLLIAYAATTALTKRIIAPLLSTPLAGWFNDNYMNKKPPQDKGRIYYEWVNLQPKYNNDLDKTAFSRVATKKTTPNI